MKSLDVLMALTVGSLSALAIGSIASCSSADFSVNGTGADAAGEAAVTPPRARDVVVRVDWPSGAALDPRQDSRGTKMRIVATDATDASRTATQDVPRDASGPFSFAGFVTSNLVDVVIELRDGSDRLLGYGERRKWDLDARSTVEVAARKRLLYFVSHDRDDGQFRVLGLTPNAADPAMDEPAVPPLTSLRLPSALSISGDGLLLAAVGQAILGDGGAGAGAVDVFETGSHVRLRTIALPFVASDAAAVGDGHRLLLVPGGTSRVAVFALADLDGAKEPEQIPTGDSGGWLDIASVAASPDGTRVVAAGDYDETNKNSEPRAFVLDVASRKVTRLDVSGLSGARGIRFTADGRSIVVAGWVNTQDWSTGKLLVFDASSLSITKTISLATNVTRPSLLVLHPTGPWAYVDNETNFSATACCNEMRIVDLDAGKEVFVAPSAASGPAYEILTALRFPYPPRRVIAGQSDNGNNVNGDFVELTQGGQAPGPIGLKFNADIGSITAMATPFGQRL